MNTNEQLLLEQWKTASELHRHMDNVTWQRFNFFMATNGVLLAALAALAGSGKLSAHPCPPLLTVLAIAIPGIGALLSIVAFFVQKRGQFYHYYRCRQAKLTEEALASLIGRRLLWLYERSLNEYVDDLQEIETIPTNETSQIDSRNREERICPKDDKPLPKELRLFFNWRLGRLPTHSVISWVALTFACFWIVVAVMSVSFYC